MDIPVDRVDDPKSLSDFDLPVSPSRSQGTSQSSFNQYKLFQNGFTLMNKQRPLVIKPSPPPFNSSGRGAKQLAKAMELQQKQQPYSEYSSSAVSGSSPLLGKQPLIEELTFVMCYGSTPCFAKVVSNPSSCKNAASESIMINPFRVNPMNDRLLISWSGVVWLAKRQSIRPVQMTMEPGGYRVVDSPEVREFIDLMVSKGRLTYPIDIEHRKDVDCDMVSLDSGSTDNTNQVDLTLYPKLPPTNGSSGVFKSVKSSPSKMEWPKSSSGSHSASCDVEVLKVPSVTQVTPTTTATVTSSTALSSSSRHPGSTAEYSSSNSILSRPLWSHHAPSAPPRVKPRLDLINSSYYQSTLLDNSGLNASNQSCSTPTESISGCLVRMNSVCNSSGSIGCGGAKSVRFTEDLTSPCTTVESLGGPSSVALDSPVALVFEGIASSHSSAPIAVSPSAGFTSVKVACVVLESAPVVVSQDTLHIPEAVMCSGDMDLLAEVCKQRSESFTSDTSECCSVDATTSSAASVERFMSPVPPSIAESGSELTAPLLLTPETNTSVTTAAAVVSVVRSVGRKRGPASAGLPPLVPSSAGKNRRNTKTSGAVGEVSGGTVNQGILLETHSEDVLEIVPVPTASVASANTTVEKPKSKSGASTKATTSKNTAVVAHVVEPRAKRAASINPVHRDAIFGTRPSSKQSAATGSWTIK